MASVLAKEIENEVKRIINFYSDYFEKTKKSPECNGMSLVITVAKVSKRNYFVGDFFVKKECAQIGNVVKNIDEDDCKIIYVF